MVVGVTEDVAKSGGGSESMSECVLERVSEDVSEDG